jgi:hypothetical protein
MKPGDNEAKEGIALAKRAIPFRRTPAPAQGGRRRSSVPAPGTGSERPGASYPPSSQVMDHGGYALDDDEEVRDEDLALDDDVDAAFDGSDDGARGSNEELDVDVELEDDDDDEADPVTTVDERSMLSYAEAAGPGLRLRSSGLTGTNTSGSQPTKRKGVRKRARSTSDTGVHRKPNVTPRSNKS